MAAATQSRMEHIYNILTISSLYLKNNDISLQYSAALAIISQLKSYLYRMQTAAANKRNSATHPSPPANPGREMLADAPSLLLNLGNRMAALQHRNDLALLLEDTLCPWFAASGMAVVLYHPGQSQYSCFVHTGTAPASDEMMQAVRQSAQPVVFAAGALPAAGMAACTGIALQRGSEKAGGLFIFSNAAIQPAQYALLRAVADQLSLATAYLLAAEALAEKTKETAALLAISNTIATIRDKQDLFRVIDQPLKKMFGYAGFELCMINADQRTHSPFLFTAAKEEAAQPFSKTGNQCFPINDGFSNRAMAQQYPVVVDLEALAQTPGAPAWALLRHRQGMRELIVMAVRNNKECIGFLYLYAKQQPSVPEENLGLLANIGLQLSAALANIRANGQIARQLVEIKTYKEQLVEENLYLQQQIQTAHNYGDIIGKSEAMMQVFHLVSQVAASDSTVLITGETGTGKELIARAIHQGSPRSHKLMVKLNCATLPANLIESELFGHEKGSFTGAIERRIGKFELANNGTLFLDEIGELPPELQVKLLRALQEREIERIGGKGTIQVNVRIIAASNRNLLKEMQTGGFRSDLFYRLNVFPVAVPPLRERREDIPIIAAHFVQQFAQKTGKNIRYIAAKVIKELTAYPWPGNVRELEHLIERSVLLTPSGAIKNILLPRYDKKDIPGSNGYAPVKTIYENERDHILAILKLCNGKISGKSGAAEILGIPPTTLNSKLKKFSIKKAHLFTGKL